MIIFQAISFVARSIALSLLLVFALQYLDLSLWVGNTLLVL